jgi:NAD(P)-dependent dehydrogenase (short-subunit alcohol dehydrogenase family)
VEVSLEGKVALVTGVGPNIGSGVALALAKYGAKVACNDVSKESIDACIARVTRNGGEAMAAPGDVTDEATVAGYVSDVLSRWGKIDILVNNAALLGGRGVLDETAEAFHRAVTVSAMGTFLNTKHVGRSMAELGVKGSIVCVSSSNGWSGTAGVCAYAFHKGGVNNFVRAAAMDLAPYGIRVNSFTPTAPNPDNPELLAERAKQGFGPGGVLSGPPGGGIGGPAGDEEWRRPTRFAGPRADGADGHHRHANRHRPRHRLALLGLRPADHRHRPGRRRRRSGEELRLYPGCARPAGRPAAADHAGRHADAGGLRPVLSAGASCCYQPWAATAMSRRAPRCGGRSRTKTDSCSAGSVLATTATTGTPPRFTGRCGVPGGT